MLGSLATTRAPHRDRCLWLVSMNAGLRAKALAALTWAMVPEAHGQIAEALQVQHRASGGPAPQAAGRCCWSSRRTLGLRRAGADLTTTLQPHRCLRVLPSVLAVCQGVDDPGRTIQIQARGRDERFAVRFVLLHPLVRHK